MILYNSSSTGTSTGYQFQAPVTRLGIQTSGTATYVVEGSVGGAWTPIVTSSTQAAGSIKYLSTGFITAKVRAVLSAVGSTDFVMHVVGA